MRRDKQIEEMAKDLCRLDRECDTCPFKKRGIECNPRHNAKRAIDKGYRKSTDVAEEIFAEIEKIAMHGTTPYGLCLMSMGEVAFAKLKKKYTESEKDNG